MPKKKSSSKQVVKVQSYNRQFRPEKLPPRDPKGRWSNKRKKRKGSVGQTALFR